MHTISFIKDLCLFDISWSGFMSTRDATRDAEDCQACLNAEKHVENYLLRIKLLDEQVLPQDTLALLSEVLADFPKPKRTAMVTPSTMVKLQIKRALMRPDMEMFDDPDRASEWLIGD